MVNQWLIKSGHFRVLKVVIAALVLSALSACGGGGGGTTTTAAPPAPELVAATSGNGQVTVTWGEVPGATSYNIYWSNTPGVTKATGTKITGAVSPYVHTGLTNGTAYYYVVTAVGPGGESVESAQVSAVPQLPPPDAPTNVSAVLTPEGPLSVTIQWDPPTSTTGQPFTYNVYRSTSPDVAARLTDPTTVKVTNVTSPYIDSVPAGQVTYYYVVTAVNSSAIEGAPSAEVSATPRGGPTGGGEVSAYGNNLSVPLVFANGVGIGGAVITGSDHTDLATGLRPTAIDVTDPFPYFNDADIYLLNGTDPYYQQQTSSTWQASWVNGDQFAQHVVADWGDNLGGSASLSQNQVIRVEMVLYQDKDPNTLAWPDGSTQPMTGYNMALLYGEGRLEMQGTDGTTYDATQRRVFAINARLKIEKLSGQYGSPVSNTCNFDGSIADGLALPDGSTAPKFSSEINVGGSLTYGFNWNLNKCADPNKAGWWRITFSLDNSADVNGVIYANNTAIDSIDPSNPTAVLVNPQETYIEVQVN